MIGGTAMPPSKLPMPLGRWHSTQPARTAARRGRQGLAALVEARPRSGSAIKRVRGQRQQRGRQRRHAQPAAGSASISAAISTACGKPSTRIRARASARSSNTGGAMPCCRGTRRSASGCAAGRRIGRYRTASPDPCGSPPRSGQLLRRVVVGSIVMLASCGCRPRASQSRCSCASTAVSAASRMSSRS